MRSDDPRVLAILNKVTQRGPRDDDIGILALALENAYIERATEHASSDDVAGSGERLREAALLVLQSQRVAMKKRPLALATSLDALRAALDAAPTTEAPPKDAPGCRLCGEAEEDHPWCPGWVAP